MIRLTSTLAVVALTAFLAVGCAADQKASSKPQPQVLGLRNSTAAVLASVTIAEDKDPSSGPLRLGSVAPVQRDFTYVFVRPTNAPPLPARVRVSWAVNGPANRSVVVSLKEVLTTADGSPTQALVFEIQSTQQVRVFLDQVKQ